MPRVLFVLGTRPEAVKLAPVIHEARRWDDWSVAVCNTGQHRELLRPVLELMQIRPEIALDVMRPGQSLDALLGRLMLGLDPVMREHKPAMVVAQGDTTTVLASAMAAFHARADFAHVEAGLRTGDRDAPFPEEGNRVLVSTLARLHFAPTQRAADALMGEGISTGIHVTGNTVVDAVRHVIGQLPAKGSPPPGMPSLPAGPLVMVTGHRRESFGAGLRSICRALRRLASRHRDVSWVYPVHLNPAVQRQVHASLGDLSNVWLCPPLRYDQAIWLMRRARFIITDSGGIQEEAPELGKPVLVTRASTERPEALERGHARLVGHDEEAIVEAAQAWLLDEPAYRSACPRDNPFGDGRAAVRCVAAMRQHLGLSNAATGRPGQAA